MTRFQKSKRRSQRNCTLPATAGRADVARNVVTSPARPMPYVTVVAVAMVMVADVAATELNRRQYGDRGVREDLAGCPHRACIVWIAVAIVIHDVVTNRLRFPALVVDPDGNGNPNDAGAMWTTGEVFTDPANGISVAIKLDRRDVSHHHHCHRNNGNGFSCFGRPGEVTTLRATVSPAGLPATCSFL